MLPIVKGVASERAFEQLTQSLQTYGVGDDARNVYKVGQNTTRLLMSAGDLMVGYLLLRQARIAIDRLDGADLSAADTAFYEGKPAVARFFAQTVLPELAARRQVTQNIDNHLMSVPTTSF